MFEVWPHANYDRKLGWDLNSWVGHQKVTWRHVSATKRLNGWLGERFAQNKFQNHKNEFQNHQNDVKVGLLLQRFCEFRGDLNQKRISEFFYFSTLVQTFSKFFKVAQGLRNAALLNCSFKIRTCQDRKLDSGHARSISSISRCGGGDFGFKITPPEIDRIVCGGLPKRRCTQ